MRWMTTATLLATLPVATAKCIMQYNAYELYPGQYAGSSNSDTYGANWCLWSERCLDGTIPPEICEIDPADLPWPYSHMGNGGWWFFMQEVQDCCVEDPFGVTSFQDNAFGLYPDCDLEISDLTEVGANDPDWPEIVPGMLVEPPVTSNPNLPEPPECNECVDPGPNVCIGDSRTFFQTVWTNPCASHPAGNTCRVGFCDNQCNSVFAVEFLNGRTEFDACVDTDNDGCIDTCENSAVSCVFGGACPEDGQRWVNGDCQTCD